MVDNALAARLTGSELGEVVFVGMKRGWLSATWSKLPGPPSSAISQNSLITPKLLPRQTGAESWSHDNEEDDDDANNNDDDGGKEENKATKTKSPCLDPVLVRDVGKPWSGGLGASRLLKYRCAILTGISGRFEMQVDGRSADVDQTVAAEGFATCGEAQWRCSTNKYVLACECDTILLAQIHGGNGSYKGRRCGHPAPQIVLPAPDGTVDHEK
ncbi:hypothetical protein COCC4DRAFT_19908 [Bipolaris maydis ATCC 48331]|uniref:Uncharacterized protein n=2 Tax=Cochliobolus heterostrophus TaxID=5016 RepID=M2URR4_COCH5|nr:uncharacterized protein COCC4DRAFT_19908 [Bipolaris maydis ATCC 48331]EMD90598.1 hypothetical protein COCHEDRAFT_1031889 [Bipolaris maydis C5]ENI09192.1 hypothetical protein COCC4DRAFT_19908 [Bipolaris maydis ATCC 48331]KAJ6206494.1 hypothetical protein PSV09DRAFT_1031889 [Bipolaris maydis]